MVRNFVPKMVQKTANGTEKTNSKAALSPAVSSVEEAVPTDIFQKTEAIASAAAELSIDSSKQAKGPGGCSG